MVLNLGNGVVVPEWFFVLVLAYGLYYAISLMTIAKKTGTEHGWMVFIPGLFPFLEARIAGVPIVSAFIYVILAGYLIFFEKVSFFMCPAGAKCISSYIHLIGIGLIILFQLWWWVKIVQKCGKSSFYGILYTAAVFFVMLPLFGLNSVLISIILGTIVLSVCAWRTAPLQDTKEEAEEGSEKQQPHIPPNMRPPDPQRKS